tara:strand:+ start:4 stop:1293 length:1290 start_codon:yes stop_codon:yes gene_type:complete
MRNIFDNSRNRKMYLAHLKTIMEENFANLNYLDSANKMYLTIDQSVLLDTNKFYTYLNFQNNLDSTVNNIIDYPGISDLMNSRLYYLRSYSGYNHNLIIDSVVESTNNISIGDDLWITANVEDATQVVLFYRSTNYGVFQEINMLDDGNNNDGLSGDLTYGAKISNIGNQTQYYIYAENDSSGLFSPKRAAYEFYEHVLPINNGDIVINELLAINNNVVQSEYGEFADWIELHNNTNSTIATNDLFITDDTINLQKWRLPNSSLPPNGYLILWADERSNQGGLHTNFRLSNNGEQIVLSNSLGQIIDSLTFPPQSTNVAYARIPNGTGPFVYNTPSYNYNNDFVSVSETYKLKFDCYPNPFMDQLNISLNSSYKSSISICDIHGKIIKSLKVDSYKKDIIFSTFSLKKGMYFVILKNNETISTQKIIKY